MPTVAELKKLCKEKHLKNYSKLKKSQLLKLLQLPDVKPSDKKSKITVVELKKKCKEKGIKGCSKMKKNELLLLFPKTETKPEFNREHKIMEMKKKTEQHYDPIYSDPFEQWTDHDLEHAVFLGNFYYQPKFLYEYIKKKYESGQLIVKDPITNKILTQDIIKDIYHKNGKQYTKPKLFYFDTSIMNIHVENKLGVRPLIKKGDNSRWNFVEVVLEYNPNQIEISGGGKRLSSNRILIANIPMGISTNPGNYEVKSLDAASTSEALLISITNLITTGKIFKIINNTKYMIKPCPIFQTPFYKWLGPGSKNHKFPDTTTPSQPYMKFVTFLSNFQ